VTAKFGVFHEKMGGSEVTYVLDFCPGRVSPSVTVLTASL